MIQFHLPQTGSGHAEPDPVVHFAVTPGAVLIAGSRRGTVPAHTASCLIAGIGQAGLSVLVGCAPGIDARFRHTCTVSPIMREQTFVACAFERRAQAIRRTGVFASLVVPDGVSPRAALRRRTLWMVKRSVLVLLFPDDPATGHWGRGSGLAFRAAVDQLKPVFVVTAQPPVRSLSYHVIRDSLWGIVDGYWVVPHPVAQGTCDEEL